MEIFKPKPQETAGFFLLSLTDISLCAWLRHWEGFGFAVEKFSSKSGEAEGSDSKGSGVRYFYTSDTH